VPYQVFMMMMTTIPHTLHTAQYNSLQFIEHSSFHSKAVR